MAQAGYVEQIKQICKDPARRKQLAQIHLNLSVRNKIKMTVKRRNQPFWLYKPLLRTE